MFDVSFSELMVIALVGLVVIGPERLPKVARTVGHLLGRLQRYVGDVKADINREMQLEDLKKLQAQVTDQVRDMERQVNDQLKSVETSLNESILTAADQKEAEALEAAKPFVPPKPPAGRLMEAGQESFISHLVELRDRLIRALVAVLVIFLGLVNWARDIYSLLAAPMLAALPEGGT